MSRRTVALVLAAGEGTRMKSSRPKPLHHLCGRPMVIYVLEALGPDSVDATVVVVGHGATWVEKEITECATPGRRLSFVEQPEQLGTGHAVSVALPAVEEALGEGDGDVVILPGDTPLLRPGTIAALLEAHVESDAALTVLSAVVDDPTGYGRIVRAKDGSLAAIVEDRDASPEVRALHEVNTSIMVVRQSVLGPALRRVGRANAQQEYYLTDVVAVLRDMGYDTRAVVAPDPGETAGVNDRLQLAAAEKVLRRRINERWLKRGVSIWDPDNTHIDADVELAVDVSVAPGSVLKGHCVIGTGAQLGPNCVLRDVTVGERAVIGAAEGTGAVVGSEAEVGSFVVLQPGAHVAPGEVVAPFTVVGP